MSQVRHRRALGKEGLWGKVRNGFGMSLKLNKLSTAKTVRELIGLGVECLTEVHPDCRVLILLGSRDDTSLCHTHQLQSEDIWSSSEINQTILSKVLTYGAVVLSNDTRKTVSYLKLEDRQNISARSVLCVPLRPQHTFESGLIYLDHPSANKFDKNLRNEIVALASELQRRTAGLPLNYNTEALYFQNSDPRSRYSQMLDAQQLLGETSEELGPKSSPLAVRDLSAIIGGLSHGLKRGKKPSEIFSTLASKSKGLQGELSRELESYLLRGFSLTQAFEATDVFPELSLAILDHGEETGELEACLSSYQASLSRRVKMEKNQDRLIKFWVLAIASLVMTAPAFMVFSSSESFMLPHLLLGTLLSINAMLAFYRSNLARSLWDLAIQKIPLLNQAFRQAAWIQFAYDFGVLRHYGMSLTNSLRLLVGESGIREVDRELFELNSSLKNGVSLEEGIRACQTAPIELKEMPVANYQTAALNQVAEKLEIQGNRRISQLEMSFKAVILLSALAIVGMIVARTFS